MDHIKTQREMLRSAILPRAEAPKYAVTSANMFAEGTWGQMMAGVQRSIRRGAVVTPSGDGKFTLTSADGRFSVHYAPVLRAAK